MTDDNEPSGSRRIRKLPPDVVNRIAAAEIIHRPSNAIKELLENALDAEATTIRITVKDGGLKMLQIVDNGHGIAREDLPLLCERYATSKLRQFQDLESLSTYGFRGEALASISYCSHLEVVTKPLSESCGWKVLYENGAMIGDPRPTGANDGTVITATDLFYNMPLRKRAFRSTSDEYARILDVVSKYAIHNPHVSWVCKKHGTAAADLSTSANSTSKANISHLISSTLAQELIEIPDTTFNAKLGTSCRGWISDGNSNWAIKKGGFILFINNRLVDSTKLKKAVEGVYTTVLAKGASPFIYLSLRIDPANIDVNVHPTKSEVHFLNEDEIVVAVVGEVERALSNANSSRTFAVQTVLPTAHASTSKVASSRRAAAPNYKVRMDPANRTLHSMVAVANPSQVPTPAPAAELIEETTMWAASQRGDNLPTETECDFTSIQELRQAVVDNRSSELSEMLSKHAYVGAVDQQACLALVQHGTKLQLVNYAALGDEHFYQLGLQQFGGIGRLKLDPPPVLSDLITIAAEAEPGITEAGLSVDSVVKKTLSLLRARAEMLDEYFSVSISADGHLEAIPLLLKGYTPDLDRLPQFLLSLAHRAVWDNEKQCFDTILREIGFFYSPRPFIAPSEEEQGERAHRQWQLEHVLFPSFRRTQWPRRLKQSAKQVANLPDLFRVFERC